MRLTNFVFDYVTEDLVCFQKAFNKVLFGGDRVSSDEFFISSGFEYSASCFIKFLDCDKDADVYVENFKNIVRWMVFIIDNMKFSVIPRYCCFVYRSKSVIYAFNMQLWMDKYNLIRDLWQNHKADILHGVLDLDLDKFFDLNNLWGQSFIQEKDKIEFELPDLRNFITKLRTMTSSIVLDKYSPGGHGVCFYNKDFNDIDNEYWVDIIKNLNWPEFSFIKIWTGKALRRVTIGKRWKTEKYRDPVFLYHDQSEKEALEELLFGDEADVDSNDPKSEDTLKTPVLIYDYLRSRLFKQDDYCKRAASIIWNHIHGIHSIYLVLGPPGCGKTYVWECLEKLYDNIVIFDSSMVTSAGTKGVNWANLMDMVSSDSSVVVLDEFDKLCRPYYVNGGNNVSYTVQSEFLKILDSMAVTSGGKISTKNMSFILCGSFNEKAEELTNKTAGVGFNRSLKSDIKPYDIDITIKDIINYGMIKELASRIIGIISLNSFDEQDFYDFVESEESSSILNSQLFGIYRNELVISKDLRRKIARIAFESGLGFRKVINMIREKADMALFDQYESVDGTKQTGVLTIN